MDELWILHPDDYSSIVQESRKVLLHPKIVEIVTKKKYSKILDYGCGDGSLIKLLPTDFEVGIYDISNRILRIAESNLKEYKNLTTYSDVNSIPDNYYDYGIFSLVLMTMSNKKDIKSAFKNLYDSIKMEGEIVVAITHPCFRTQNFSSFFTSYSVDKSFKYFKEGEKFEVFIRDTKNEDILSFNDYHWTLSTTINLLCDSNFSILEFMELPDKPIHDNSFTNVSYSPYIIIRAKKI